MAARALPWALWLFASCAALRPADPDKVALETLRLDFPAPDVGELEFSALLPAPAPRVDQATWELLVDGVPFAAGVEGQRALSGQLVTVRAPLVYRHLQWKDGEVRVDVRLRGAIEVPGRRYTFRERRELTVRGHPVLNVPFE